MKVVALLSGGKDSCYNLMHCLANGHEVVALATLVPEVGIDELDSYMYQSIGTSLFLPLIAQALRLPLYRHTISGKPLNVSSTYGSRFGPASSSASISESDRTDSTKKEDETEDLTSLLNLVLSHHPEINALSSGAILSTYQRLRIEHVASRLGLTCLSFLWQRPERTLVDEMIAAGLGDGVILVKVAGLGLEVEDVGRTLGSMRRKLGVLEDKYGCHVAGEGGEFETITLDCPLFHERIEILKSETIVTDPSPVAYLRATSARLLPKTSTSASGGAVSYVPPTSKELRALLCIEAKGIEGMSLFDERSEELFQELEAWRNTSALASLAAAPAMEDSEAKPLTSSSSEQPIRIAPSFGRKGNWFCVSVEGWTENGEAIEAEVTRCFEQLQETLRQEHLSLLQIQHQNFLLSDMSDFPLANKAYSTFFGTSPPSRACVSVPLPPHQRVRLEACGFDDTDTEPNTPEARSALHVQSMSYWAPANIGPYSQAVMVNNRLSIAGQIGLIPPTLTFPEPRSFRMEAVLALQHVRRIVQVLRSKDSAGGGWEGWVEGVVGWYSREEDLEEARKIWRLHCEADDLYRRTPIIFVQARQLPKGALVEWQFSMHSGRLASSSDALREDPDARAECAYAARSGGLHEQNEQSCDSVDVQASFGIVTCSDVGGQMSQRLLDRSFSVRLFHLSDIPNAELQAIRQRLASNGSEIVLSLVPCLRISSLIATDRRYGLIGLGI